MKVGDIVKVKNEHHSHPGMIGVVLEDFSRTTHNKGKAFRILFSDGKIRTKMARSLEIINEAR
tara:strand:- start:2152 stop:2340 length:189 start_codon:yes stop_codon:yes gene_type:complete